MSAKDILLDFINYLFIIIIGVFFFFFFLAGDRFVVFTQIMKALLPLSFFGLIFLIKLKFSRNLLRERKNYGETDLVIYLSYFDKFKTELLVFLLPIVILFVSFLDGFRVTIIDFIQAGLAFVLVYAWQKILFRKGAN